MLFVLQAGGEMEDTLVYGGVEGGGTHSTAMIFNQVNRQWLDYGCTAWAQSPREAETKWKSR